MEGMLPWMLLDEADLGIFFPAVDEVEEVDAARDTSPSLSPLPSFASLPFLLRLGGSVS